MECDQTKGTIVRCNNDERVVHVENFVQKVLACCLLCNFSSFIVLWTFLFNEPIGIQNARNEKTFWTSTHLIYLYQVGVSVNFLEWAGWNLKLEKMQICHYSIVQHVSRRRFSFDMKFYIAFRVSVTMAKIHCTNSFGLWTPWKNDHLQISFLYD